MIAQAQHEPLALDMLASEASHMRPEPASADERTIEVAEVLADPATETLAGSTDAEGGSTPSDDEQLQAFAPGSVVLILGNARTRASLHGQRATVSRATGLGGWHWLTLEETQERVKVQRNGLRLQSLPPAGPPPPAPREKAKPKAKPQPARPKLASRDSGERIAKRKTARVDLSKLNGSALRKYSEVYQLPWGSGVSRDELAAQVMEHFRCELTVGNEDDVIHDFASAVSRTTDHSQRGFQAYGARSLCA